MKLFIGKSNCGKCNFADLETFRSILITGPIRSGKSHIIENTLEINRSVLKDIQVVKLDWRSLTEDNLGQLVALEKKLSLGTDEKFLLILDEIPLGQNDIEKRILDLTTTLIRRYSEKNLFSILVTQLLSNISGDLNSQIGIRISTSSIVDGRTHCNISSVVNAPEQIFI